MSILKVFFLIVLLTFFLLFITQNAGYVEVRFFNVVYHIPLFVLLLFTFAVGFLLPTFYLLLRETLLKRRLNSLKEGLRELSRGYFNRAERLLLSAGSFFEPAKFLIAEIVHRQGRVEELKSFNSTALATVGEILLRDGNFQEAEVKLNQAILEDEENLRAIKGLRNLYAILEDWERALDYQEKVLGLCEKWEREKQKAIKAEIMAMAYLKNGEEKLIEKAFDLSSSPFVYSVYIRHLLSQDKLKDAKKLWERSIDMGYQDEVLWNLLEDERALTKLLDIIQSKQEAIQPNILCMVYLKLNLFSKAKDLEEKLTNPFKALVYSSQSHREQDRYCLLGIKELLKPFVCSCGKVYNTYTPLCTGCMRWREISLRRDIYAGRP